MSALADYRKECASRGLWPVPEDGSLLCIADAALAELEAELAALRDLLGSISVHHPHLVPDLEEFCSEWRARP